MYPTLFKIAAFATVFAWQIALHPREVTAVPLPKWIGSLPDAHQNLIEVRLASNHRLQVVCFLGCDCPLARLYGPRLMQLAELFKEQDVTFVGINSNPQDSLSDVTKYVDELGITFPVLKDHDQVALAALDAKRTPEVIVLDAAGAEVYRGRIDDQYQPGITRSQPTRHDLRAAIEEYLNGTAVSQPRTESAGCLIARRRLANPDAPITFCNQIARILNQHCVECHRPGEIGPFALVEYDEVVGWADMMLETIEQHRMPPWHADPAHGDFINARHIPEADRERLRRWVADGTPYGHAVELPKSDAASAAGESSAIRADLEIPMRAEPYAVAAEGTIEYQYFVVDPKFEEDRWVRHAELIPSNRSVVHHGIVFVRPPDGVLLDGIGWLTAYVPGQVSPTSPAHRARRVPAGSKFVFQMHYTPNGKPEQDLSVLRLVFADPAQVTEEHISLTSLNQELEIPPGAADVPVEGGTPTLPIDGQLLAISPHMHLRGKSVRVETKIGQVRKILLNVPHYDFNWQHTYILQEPIALNSIQELKFTATFDNSKENLFNPDPTAFVTWGEQTWEEMAVVFYEVAVPIAEKKKKIVEPPASTEGSLSSSEDLDRQRAIVDQLFEDLDGDGDGKIEYEEVDQAVQMRSYRWYDLNGDRIVDPEEALEAVRRMNR